ncbi:hypothetical protein [Rhizobium sp. 11_C7_N12_5]|uniref:hypothetical protein n=1 Tax=Rhizobium sp. 11_C7_N12_5 TaxID=3240770 RepID=UPI003F1EDAB0
MIKAAKGTEEEQNAAIDFFVDELSSDVAHPRFSNRYSAYCPNSQGNDALTTLECRSWLLALYPPEGE